MFLDFSLSSSQCTNHYSIYFNLPVDKNLSALLKSTMNKCIGIREMLDQISLVHIGDRNHFVDELAGEPGCRNVCHLDDMCDPELLQLFTRL